MDIHTISALVSQRHKPSDGRCFLLTSADETAALVNLTNFLDHGKTVELIGHYEHEISASKEVGGVLHMGETGTVACHGKEGVSNTLGAALWELDYALTGAAEGFDRFMFHNGQGDYYYSMWEPVGTELHPGAHIYPTLVSFGLPTCLMEGLTTIRRYYAMLFVADLVEDLKDPSVARLTDLDTDSLVHFAIYDCGRLAKVVLLNLNFSDETSTRSSIKLSLSHVLGNDLHVRRLTGTESAAQTGVTWAGQKVDDSGNLIGLLDVEDVNDGVVTLLASEGVIVEASAGGRE